MKTSARYQAVLEILIEVFSNQKPADKIINEYLRARKYIGSKDRRFIVDTAWEIIRRRMRLSFDISSENPRDILLAYLKDEDFDIVADGSEYGLAPLTKEEKNKLKNLKEDVYPLYVELECPQWLFDKIDNTSLVSALNTTAPADLRVNLCAREDVRRRLQREGLFFAPTPYSPYGLRSSERVNLNNCAAYQEGLVDVQDESSQIAAVLCHVRPHEKVIDYCAGAGGKSLAIAAINHNEGLIYAHDVNWNRMDAIKNRAERLGIKNIKLIQHLEDKDYDCFIVDAPCSGSGTWRRSPDSKFRLTPKNIEELNTAQLESLEKAYQHTKAGGRLIYMTCSILKEENENIIQNFLQKHPDIQTVNHQELWEKRLEIPYIFQEKSFIKLSPLTTNTDGFFFCAMIKNNHQ